MTPSIRLNTTGTNSSDSTVDKSNPPITAMAMGERNSDPSAVEMAEGSIPAAMAMVVITIGRARFRAASISAAARRCGKIAEEQDAEQGRAHGADAGPDRVGGAEGQGAERQAQQAAQREERGIALAPVLLVLGGVAMVTKYVGLARGEMDMYLMGGVGIAFFMVAGPFLRKLVMVK